MQNTLTAQISVRFHDSAPQSVTVCYIFCNIPENRRTSWSVFFGGLPFLLRGWYVRKSENTDEARASIFF